MSTYQCYIVERVAGEDGERYRIPDTEALLTYGQLEPGAMYPIGRADAKAGSDGKTWTVKCPGGYPWSIDSPQSNSTGHWHRTGEAPNFTATPSIHVTCAQFAETANALGHFPVVGTKTLYHGHLINGVLESTPDSPC
jgi:hypothetical protein